MNYSISHPLRGEGQCAAAGCGSSDIIKHILNKMIWYFNLIVRHLMVYLFDFGTLDAPYQTSCFSHFYTIIQGFIFSTKLLYCAIGMLFLIFTRNGPHFSLVHHVDLCVISWVNMINKREKQRFLSNSTRLPCLAT